MLVENNKRDGVSGYGDHPIGTARENGEESWHHLIDLTSLNSSEGIVVINHHQLINHDPSTCQSPPINSSEALLYSSITIPQLINSSTRLISVIHTSQKR